MTTSPGPPASRATAGALAVICTAQFVLQLDFSIVNVALPDIQTDLGFTAADLQWVVTGYALTFGSLLLVGGRAGDLFGRRRLLVAGLVVFAVASVACGLAVSPLMLVLARIVQGCGGALVSPTALGLLTGLFAEGRALPRALGIWQATTAGGATAGIIAGGLLTQLISWRAIFLVNIPIIIIILIFIARFVPAVPRIAGGHLDVVGAALIATASAALIFGLSRGQQAGFSSPSSLIPLIGSVVLAAAFVVYERRVSVPMLPLKILASRERRAALFAMLLMGAVVASYVYFTSLYLQLSLGLTPVQTGLALIPATVVVVALSVASPRLLLPRLGVKATLLLGLGLIAAGQLWLWQLPGHGSYGVGVVPGLVLTAMGMGVAFPTASVAVNADVADVDRGVAGGLFSTSQQVGSAVGLAALATVAAAVTRSTPSSPVAGYQLAFLVSAALMGVAILFVLFELDRSSCARELRRQQQLADAGAPAPGGLLDAPLRRS